MDGRSFLWRRPLFLIEKAIQRCKIAGSYESSNTGACEYGDAVTTGVPRRFVSELAGLRPRLACLFDPEFTPAFRTDLAVDERAGVRLLEERAIAALLIVLWCVVVPAML